MVRTTLAAAPTDVSPACEAVIEQLPPESDVKVVPLIEHVEDDVEKLTGYEFPALLDATNVWVPPVPVMVVGAVKVMICCPAEIVMLRATSAAATYELSPFCDAVIVQRPAANG